MSDAPRDHLLEPPDEPDGLDPWERYLQEGDEAYDDLELDEIDERYGDL